MSKHDFAYKNGIDNMTVSMGSTGDLASRDGGTDGKASERGFMLRSDKRETDSVDDHDVLDHNSNLDQTQVMLAMKNNTSVYTICSNVSQEVHMKEEKRRRSTSRPGRQETEPQRRF